MSHHFARRTRVLAPLLLIAALAPAGQAVGYDDGDGTAAASPAASSKPTESAHARRSTGTGPWGNEAYTPKRGSWRDYVLSPHSRTIRPAAVQGVRPRGGSVVGAASALLAQDGKTVRIVSTGDRTVSPLITLDMGKEVAGPARVRVVSQSDPAPVLHVCYSESMQYAALGQGQNSGQTAIAPGCDTANIWNGFPGTPYTFDSDSHTVPVDASALPATVTDPELRGGYRYVTLFLDGPGSIEVDSVTTHFSAANGQKRLDAYPGHFLSSDNLLNKIWYAGAYTVQLNTGAPDTAKSWPYADGEADHADDQVPGADPDQDVIYDGGKRDRIVWQGDLAVQNPTTMVSTRDRTAIRNSLTSLASQQLADGFVPAESLVGPHNVDEMRTYGEYVTWFVHNMADYHLWTGDTAYLTRWWPAVQQAAAWLEDQRDSTGLISFDSSNACGHYGYTDCGHETYVNALYVRNLQELATMARVVGTSDEVARYRGRATEVRTEINRQLWDGQAGAYRLSTEIPDVFPQDANATAALTGVASTSRIRLALAYLRANNWDNLGSRTVSAATPTSAMASFYAPLPSWFEVEARLTAPHGAGPVQQGGITLMKRFWGWMLQQDPGSTFWEHVMPSGNPNLDQFSSLAHGWASGPTVSLTTQVLGVAPTSAGFKTFSVAPHPAGLRWAEGTVPTPTGKIRTAWTSSGRAFDLNVTAPPRTRAAVTIPLAGRGLSVTVDGRTVWSRSSRAHRASYVDHHVVVRGLAPGRHVIKVKRLAPVRTDATVTLSTKNPTADVGDVLTFDAVVNGVAPGRLTGTLQVTTPQGWTVSQRSIAVSLPSGGRPVDHQYRFFVQVPQDTTARTAKIKVALRAGPSTATASTTVALRRSMTLFDFEDGTTQGWVAGENVGSVAAVTSMDNGPTRPYAGSYELEAVGQGVVGALPRTVSYEADTPLDLASARTLELHTDSYGGLPDADHYQIQVHLEGSDGSDVDQAFTVGSDVWNNLSVDLSGWASRDSISRIDVSFSAVGSTTPWSSRFQIDQIGWSN